VKPLVGPDGIEVQDPAQITELFNSQFSSVLTAENKTEVPCPLSIFTGSDYDKLCDIVFIEDEVLKRLLRLWEDKSAGADDIASRLLKAISSEVAIGQCQKVKSLMTGRWQMSHLFSNKAVKT